MSIPPDPSAKVTVLVYLDSNLVRELRIQAEKNNRTLSLHINHLLKRLFREQEKE